MLARLLLAKVYDKLGRHTAEERKSLCSCVRGFSFFGRGSED
jgi:hypothetical protein